MPAFENAACLGRWELFDLTMEDCEPYAVEAAMRLCAGCPALPQCREWIDSLPPRQRPYGVVAARLRKQRITGKEIPA